MWNKAQAAWGNVASSIQSMSSSLARLPSIHMFPKRSHLPTDRQIRLGGGGIPELTPASSVKSGDIGAMGIWHDQIH
jgi:hypothetical protein